MILATQKPAGVVNEQIRGNSRFRVCLKVNDRSDSSDVLQRPEAADLKDTGRFYLQVGHNEVFEIGQSAWSGAEYRQADDVSAETSVSRIRSSIGGKEPKTAPAASNTSTQLLSVVRMLNDIAAEQGIHERQLWEAALPKTIDADQEAVNLNDPEGSSCCIPVGKIDDPGNQTQFILSPDLSKLHNLIVFGEAGSGKTTCIQTLLLSICRAYSPDEIQFHIMDYSGRLFKAFRASPHCGEVLDEDDNGKLSVFFSFIAEIIAERKKLFSKLSVDSFDGRNDPYAQQLIVFSCIL